MSFRRPAVARSPVRPRSLPVAARGHALLGAGWWRALDDSGAWARLELRPDRCAGEAGAPALAASWGRLHLGDASLLEIAGDFPVASGPPFDGLADLMRLALARFDPALLDAFGGALTVDSAPPPEAGRVPMSLTLVAREGAERFSFSVHCALDHLRRWLERPGWCPAPSLDAYVPPAALSVSGPLCWGRCRVSLRAARALRPGDALLLDASAVDGRVEGQLQLQGWHVSACLDTEGVVRLHREGLS